MSDNEFQTKLQAYKALAEKLNKENGELLSLLRLHVEQNDYRLLYRGSARWCEAGKGGISHAYDTIEPEDLSLHDLYIDNRKIKGVMRQAGDYCLVYLDPQPPKPEEVDEF